jgi:hypothetical protein
MKKIILTLTTLFLTTLCFAQQNIVKVGFAGNTGIQFERSFFKQFSVAGQVGYSRIQATINDERNNSSGFGYAFEARYYFSSTKETMEGWYIGPYYFKNFLEDERGNEGDFSSVGGKVGYQWIFNSNITAEVAGGLGTMDVGGKITEIYLLGILRFYPYVGFSLGYNF